MKPAALPENPRAIIGHNSVAAGEGVTVEEARMTMRAVEYVQWCWPEIKSILIKHSKKHKMEMAFRIAVAHALRGEVRLDSLRILLGLNRKTCSENQQRPEIWAEHDPLFDTVMEDFREVIYRHGRLDREVMTARLAHWIAADPALRALEKEEKAQNKALAHEKERAEIAALRARLDQIAALKAALHAGGVNAAASIAARLASPESIAKALSDDGVELLARMMHREAKGKRDPASAYDDEALDECKRFGLAREIVPHLSKDADPGIGPTALAARVYVEAVASKRIAVKKRGPSNER